MIVAPEVTVETLNSFCEGFWDRLGHRHGRIHGHGLFSRLWHWLSGMAAVRNNNADPFLGLADYSCVGSCLFLGGSRRDNWSETFKAAGTLATF
jgi:hypothetical protein